LLRSLPVLLFGVYILYYSFNNYDLISGGLLWIVMSVLVVYQQRETAFQQALPSSPPVSPDEN
jgi:hypothetical protein